jgi:ribosomal protein S18 acetylase RimI-like enzyme
MVIIKRGEIFRTALGEFYKMKYYKKITLKDGRKCCLRNATEKDGEAVLENFLLTHDQTDFLLSYPDENTKTVESEAEFLKKRTESFDEIEILAEIDGKVVGLAGIGCIGRLFKLNHRAEFGVSVDKNYWHLGIGRALTEACIGCAKKAGYVQLELDVVSDNKAAISLYESVGFVEYGRNPKGFRSRISGFQELVLMRLELL